MTCEHKNVQRLYYRGPRPARGFKEAVWRCIDCGGSVESRPVAKTPKATKRVPGSKEEVK